MGNPFDDDGPCDPEDAAPGGPATVHRLTVGADATGQRLDKALAASAAGTDGLSRTRIAEALAEGRVADESGATVTARGRKVKAGELFLVTLPAPAPARPEAEATPLAIVHEDAHLVVVDKPAGMVVHPAPGAETGTLVNALLHHCGESLAGIGGERRPGIVHRIDKETSGLLVVAKTEAAMAGLAALFARREIEREYRALLWGRPDRADPRLAGMAGVSFEPEGVIRVEADIARHPTDRKRMAVTRRGGRHAVSRLKVLESFGADPARTRGAGPGDAVSLAAFRLETGRTHQIRVHAAHIGHPLVGDQTYGRARQPGRSGFDAEAAGRLAAFPRQALHAARLGFHHPVTGAFLNFTSELPEDIHELLKVLRRTAPIVP